MKATIDLPESLLNEVRTAAQRKGWTVRVLFEESLRTFLASEAAAGTPEPFTLRHSVVHGETAPAMTFSEMLEVSGVNRRSE